MAVISLNTVTVSEYGNTSTNADSTDSESYGIDPVKVILARFTYSENTTAKKIIGQTAVVLPQGPNFIILSNYNYCLTYDA
jgi:hypothetical protein